MAFFCTGYAFAFGDGNGFCGTEYFGLIGLPDYKLAHFFFQFTFAATSTTIVKGTIHERCTMTAYFCYSVFISGKRNLSLSLINKLQLLMTLDYLLVTAAYVYPVASHWAAADSGW